MTRVALLWHMHQPFYQDLVTGEHVMPWVRLHALKDYWGMVALLREFPDIRVTFNLVPSLLVQLGAFARDEARDRHLEIGLKPADRLTDEERTFCVDEFFHAHRPRMIDPYPRYAELLALRGPEGGPSARNRAAQFSTQDLRDLQVWHKLVWIDVFYHDRDERVRGLLEKGRNFTEEDKAVLRQVELELLGRVVPEYREAAARGQIELSTSPFYHPILPLLCDSHIHLRTHPQARVPRERFVHPEDALEQLMRAAVFHESLFGHRPKGVWPSEGSVSDAIVPLVVRAGFSWMATDEEILARSLGRGLTRDGAGHAEQPELLYRPYRVGPEGQDVACGFRDHTLSDLIGFTYASWPADAAADDFVARLTEAGRRWSARAAGGEATIFVILDGENAWEHYEGQGRPFLRAVYARLQANPELRTVTMSDACAPAADRLHSIAPGSWINGDFYIWIGHPDDHRAWAQLAEARRALDTPPPGLPVASLERAREELLVAEGSDWFWWYGDDHSSEHDAVFDELFRRHVQNVYRALERPVPEELFVTNITTRPPAVEIHRPTGFIEPVLDGEVTSYFEWLGAGCVEAIATTGAMHQVSAGDPRIELIEFGFDPDHLFVRVTMSQPAAEVLASGVSVSVNFLTPPGLRIVVRRAEAEGALETGLQVRQRDGSSSPRACVGIAAAAGRVLEVQVPFRCLGLKPRSELAFLVALNRGTVELEHQPRLRPIELDVPDEQFAAAHWTV